MPSRTPRYPLQRNVVIGERPLTHEADTSWHNAIDDQLGVVERAEILAEEGIAVPDFGTDARIGENLGNAGDSNLIVMFIKVVELDFRIRRDFMRLVVAAQIGDVDRETINPDGRDGTNAGL